MPIFIGSPFVCPVEYPVLVRDVTSHGYYFTQDTQPCINATPYTNGEIVEYAIPVDGNTSLNIRLKVPVDPYVDQYAFRTSQIYYRLFFVDLDTFSTVIGVTPPGQVENIISEWPTNVVSGGYWDGTYLDVDVEVTATIKLQEATRPNYTGYEPIFTSGSNYGLIGFEVTTPGTPFSFNVLEMTVTTGGTPQSFFWTANKGCTEMP